MSATIKEQSEWLSESAANHRDWAEWGARNPDDPRLKINGDTEHHALWADREQACADALLNQKKLADKAVVALHMLRHAGARGLLFAECRQGLCRDWHEQNPTGEMLG